MLTSIREWRPFKNSARSDGLRLSHWVKASTDPEVGKLWPSLSVIMKMSCLNLTLLDYPFAKYNVQGPQYVYTQEEYTRLLEGAYFMV